VLHSCPQYFVKAPNRVLFSTLRAFGLVFGVWFSMLIKVLQFSTIGNQVKYQNENSLLCNLNLLGFVFGAVTHRIF